MHAPIAKRRQIEGPALALAAVLGLSPFMVAASQHVDPIREDSMAFDTVRVGSGVVDGSFYEDLEAEYRLTRIDADGTTSSAGRWTDRLNVVEIGGRKLLRREVARFDGADTKDLWRVHLADHATLEPVRLHQQAGEELSQVTHIDFDGKTVTASILPGPEADAVHQAFELEEVTFDASLFAILLASFPLSEGYGAVYPILAPGGAIRWETMQVTGTERVETINGPVDAWVVETESLPWTAWLTKEAPYIAKIEQRWPDGSRWISEQVR